MAAPTFDVLRPTITRVEKPTLPFAASLVPFADPTSAIPLLLGEWLSRSGEQLVRLAGADNAEVTVPTFPYWEWTGQTDVQSSLKGTILLPVYEAWTLAWDYLTNPPTTYGDRLTIAKMPAGHAYASYNVPRISGGGGWVVGWALSPIPTAVGQQLIFRANY